MNTAKPTKPMSVFSAAACFVALLCGADAALADAEIPTYSARYQIDVKGLGAERIQSLERNGDNYMLRSVTEARGIARLVRRRPVVEESLFELHDGMPRPLQFHLEDGTRKGEDNVTIDFDWPSGTAHVVTEDGRHELPLEPGVHDPGTLQLALMLEFEAQTEPAPHALIDDASVKTYSYEVAGEETLDTPTGTYDTIKVVQQRDGSSRHTIIWLAPELGHLPVKIEQRRDDEISMTLLLESVQGLPSN